MRPLRPVRRMAPEVPAAGLRGYGGDRKGTLPGIAGGYAPVRSVTPLIFSAEPGFPLRFRCLQSMGRGLQGREMSVAWTQKAGRGRAAGF